MAKKILLYKLTTGEVVTSVASIDGDKFKSYIEEGFKPICIIENIGRVGVTTESYSEAKHRELNN